MVEENPGNFTVTAGLPFSLSVRVEGQAVVWPTPESFEARMQIRAVKGDPLSLLLYNFTPHLEKAVDGVDLIVSWALTGAQTRELVGGYYDLIISDPGPEDARALPPILSGKIKIKQLITSAEDPT